MNSIADVIAKHGIDDEVAADIIEAAMNTVVPREEDVTYLRQRHGDNLHELLTQSCFLQQRLQTRLDLSNIVIKLRYGE
jgi:hypothetical protein